MAAPGDAGPRDLSLEDPPLAQRSALITGITGQDGSYLAESLLEKGYRVVGMTRRTSTDVHERIEHIVDRIEIVSGDLLDQSSMTNLVAQVLPDGSTISRPSRSCRPRGRSPC